MNVNNFLTNVNFNQSLCNTHFLKVVVTATLKYLETPHANQ